MKSISQVIGDIEDAEDFDALFLQTATINLMNAAVAKRGQRRVWITDDTRAYNAIYEIIMGISPMRTQYQGEGKVETRPQEPIVRNQSVRVDPNPSMPKNPDIDLEAEIQNALTMGSDLPMSRAAE